MVYTLWSIKGLRFARISFIIYIKIAAEKRTSLLFIVVMTEKNWDSRCCLLKMLKRVYERERVTVKDIDSGGMDNVVMMVVLRWNSLDPQGRCVRMKSTMFLTENNVVRNGVKVYSVDCNEEYFEMMLGRNRTFTELLDFNEPGGWQILKSFDELSDNE